MFRKTNIMLKAVGKYICVRPHSFVNVGVIVNIAIDYDLNYSSYNWVDARVKGNTLCISPELFRENYLESIGLISLKKYRKIKLLKIQENE